MDKYIVAMFGVFFPDTTVKELFKLKGDYEFDEYSCLTDILIDRHKGEMVGRSAYNKAYDEGREGCEVTCASGGVLVYYEEMDEILTLGVPYGIQKLDCSGELMQRAKIAIISLGSSRGLNFKASGIGWYIFDSSEIYVEKVASHE